MERDRVSALVGTLALATGVLASTNCVEASAKQLVAQPSQTMFIAENKAGGEKGKEMACGKGSCGTDEKGAAAAAKKHEAAAAKPAEKKAATTTDKVTKAK